MCMVSEILLFYFFFFKQKTAYEMRISDWSSDVCSSDLPDVLDPDQSRTFVGRIVYTSLCDKLVDITPELKLIPQLATAWSWSDDSKTLTMDLREGVVFHDGTPFNAEAVKANIERSKTLPESRRQSEVKSTEERRVGKEWISTGRSRGAT